MLQRCDCCDGHMEEHEQDCPHDGLKKLTDNLWRQKVTCPACHGSLRMAINKDDFYECEDCRVRCSTGLGSGSDPDTLPRVVLINVDANMHVPAVILKGKGRGQFKHRLAIRMYQSEILRWRKAKRVREHARRAASKE